MISCSSPLKRSDLKKSSIGISRPSQSFLIVEIVTLLFLPLTREFDSNTTEKMRKSLV